MKKCSACNTDVDDNLSYCTNCGNNKFIGDSVVNNNQINNTTYETHSIVWGIIGFLFPIVGIIIYFVMKKKNYLGARAALIGSLASIVFFLIRVVFYIIYIFVM